MLVVDFGPPGKLFDRAEGLLLRGSLALSGGGLLWCVVQVSFCVLLMALIRMCELVSLLNFVVPVGNFFLLFSILLFLLFFAEY